jgi:hypothetical protein
MSRGNPKTGIDQAALGIVVPVKARPGCDQIP